MVCPYCGVEYESKVTNSRIVAKFGSIRRRRECLVCKKRFTTYEIHSEDMKKLEKMLASDRRR